MQDKETTLLTPPLLLPLLLPLPLRLAAHLLPLLLLLPLLPRRSPARQEVSAFQNEGRGPRVLARRWPGPSLGSRRSQPNCSILYPNLPLIDRPGRECGLFGAISGGMAEHSAARVETLLMPRRGLQLGPASISWNFA